MYDVRPAGLYYNTMYDVRPAGLYYSTMYDVRPAGLYYSTMYDVRPAGLYYSTICTMLGLLDLHKELHVVSSASHPQWDNYTCRLKDETEGSTGFTAPRKPHTSVSIGFQGDLNPVGPKGFIV